MSGGRMLSTASQPDHGARVASLLKAKPAPGGPECLPQARRRAAQHVLAAQHRAPTRLRARPASAVLLTGIAADWSCWLVGRVVGA